MSNATTRKRNVIPNSRKHLRQIVAEWLKRGMAQSKLSQTALADKAGVSRATVNRLVQQKQDAEEQTIKRLARAMRYDFPDFDVAFSEPDDSSAKRDKTGAGSPPAARSVRESGNPYSGVEDEDSAYLRFTLQMTRELSAAEREGASQQVLLRLVDLAEKVAVPIHGPRAKAFLDAERQRIQRGDKLD